MLTKMVFGVDQAAVNIAHDFIEFWTHSFTQLLGPAIPQQS